VTRDLDPDVPGMHDYLSERRPSPSVPTELDRVEVLIAQCEGRIEAWEAERTRAERAWHRGVREVDRRGLTKADNIVEALWEVTERGRLWVPEERLAEDRALLEHLYRVWSDLVEVG
jgi:hypothetical protein